MDWFKGNFTGNGTFDHQRNRGFYNIYIYIDIYIL